MGLRKGRSLGCRAAKRSAERARAERERPRRSPDPRSVTSTTSRGKTFSPDVTKLSSAESRFGRASMSDI